VETSGLDAYATQVEADSPLSYWRLGEPSGVTAYDQQGINNASISGSVNLGVPSVLTDNGVMGFTGGEADAPANAGFDSLFTGSYSAEFWFKTAFSGNQGIIGRGDGGNGPNECNFQFGVGIGPTRVLEGSNHLVYYTGDAATVDGLVSSRQNLDDGAWHYVVVERDASTSPPTLRMFIDGGLDSSAPEVDPPCSSTQPLRIGSDGGLIPAFSGTLGEVALYPSVLSPARVLAHYQAAGIVAAYSWGAGASGQLGDGSNSDQLTPSPVTGTPRIARVSASEDFTVAVATDGTAWSWGVNDAGQLGNGTATPSLTPVPVTMPSGVSFTAVATGSGGCCRGPRPGA
jgi:hypothetical protein